jgi:hypothetical protein
LEEFHRDLLILARRFLRFRLCDFSAIVLTYLECAMVVTAGTKAYKPVARFANPALIVAFLWFSWPQCLCILGCLFGPVDDGCRGNSRRFNPALIYAGTRAWAALTIESRRAA